MILFKAEFIIMIKSLEILGWKICATRIIKMTGRLSLTGRRKSLIKQNMTEWDADSSQFTFNRTLLTFKAIVLDIDYSPERGYVRSFKRTEWNDLDNKTHRHTHSQALCKDVTMPLASKCILLFLEFHFQFGLNIRF